MYSGLELIEANPADSVKSEVMSLAAQYREEGMSPSDALSEAWNDVAGNGVDVGEDYDMMFEAKPKRRPRASNPSSETSGLGTVLLFGVGGYLLWCFFKSTYKGLAWSWQPWKAPAPLSRQIRAPIVTQPGISMVRNDNSHDILYKAKDFTEETIRIITP